MCGADSDFSMDQVGDWLACVGRQDRGLKVSSGLAPRESQCLTETAPTSSQGD